MSPQSPALDFIKGHFQRLELRTRLTVRTIRTIDDEEAALFNGFTRIMDSKLDIVSELVAFVEPHEFDESKIGVMLYTQGLEKLVFCDFGFGNLPGAQKQTYRDWKLKHKDEALRVLGMIRGLAV